MLVGKVYVSLVGGFKYFLFSPLFGQDFQFDYYFSNGLKPPTSFVRSAYFPTGFPTAQLRTQKASGRESRTADAVKTQMVGGRYMFFLFKYVVSFLSFAEMMQEVISKMARHKRKVPLLNDAPKWANDWRGSGP